VLYQLASGNYFSPANAQGILSLTIRFENFIGDLAPMPFSQGTLRRCAKWVEGKERNDAKF